MQSKATVNNLSHKTNEATPNTVEPTPNTVEPTTNRPNIDHLIKRILVERRKEYRRNFMLGVFLLFTFGVLAVFLL